MGAITQNTLRGIIFDMDGVLVDSHPFHRQAWRLFLSRCGKEISEQDLEFVIEGRTREEILVHFLGNLSSEELKQKGALKDSLFRQVSDEVRLVPGVADFLAEAKRRDLRVAVATSGARNRTNFLLGRLGVLDSFDTTITSDEVSAGKPDPELFITAAARIGLSPQEVVVFEDAINGVYAAAAARMTCYGIAAANRISVLKQAGALDVFPDFRNVRIESLRALSVTQNGNGNGASSGSVSPPQRWQGIE